MAYTKHKPNRRVIDKITGKIVFMGKKITSKGIAYEVYWQELGARRSRLITTENQDHIVPFDEGNFKYLTEGQREIAKSL